MGAEDTGIPQAAAGRPLSIMLFELAHATTRERIRIGDLLQALGDRAHGALMFVFAVPNIMPVPPGVSAVLGAPLIFLSLQLVFGQSPWLPRLIASRSLAREDFAALTRRVIPWLTKAERLLRPRATVLALPPVENLIGLLCLILAIILALPIPLGNTLPALSISVLALGILERDGFWIVAGAAISALTLAVVSGVVFAVLQGALLLLGRWIG